DGNVEVLVNNSHDRPSLLKNFGDHGNWLLLKLQGTRSNRDAIGARVTILADGHRQMQEVRSGGSYMSQSEFRLHFGLGTAPRVESLEVRWPTGSVQRITNVKSNRILAIKEDAPTQPR